MKRTAAVALGLLLTSTTLTAVAAPPPPATSPAAPLIERAKFFGNPSRTQAKLSPDGKWLSWIAPRDGVMNVWVAPTADPTQAKALTAEKNRPIPEHFWSPDSKMVLFINDKGGDENFVLYGVTVATGAQRTLTPQEKTRVQIVGTSHRIKDRILVGLNNRDPKWFDIYSLDLAKGALTLVFKNESYDGFTADEGLKLRLAGKPGPDGGTDFFRVVDNKVESQPLSGVSLDDSMTTYPMGYTTDGKTLYWVDSRGHDTAALIAQDAATGATKVVGQSAKADVGDVLADPKTGVVQAYSVDYLRTEWTALDPKIGAELDFLKAQLKGDIHVTSRTEDDGAWIVVVDPVTAPAATYRFDRKAHTLTRLFVNRPELEGVKLAAMHPVEIKARDGLSLISYLTLPAGADGKGDGHPDQPLPLVLFVHGGPWSRDSYGYHSHHQWLANRGYAVLSVNYRGSTGFGKNFITAGNLQWGRKMHDDLIDAVDWAVSQGITTKDKVAIMGGSYGGYATLAGVAFTPDTFACGVDIVGPSNLETLLKTFPAYWEPAKQQFYKRMGDPTTEDGRQLLHNASPLFKAAAITKPLMIAQGGNDPRVNKAESDQIVTAMKEKNIPVTYLLFPDEGHGFARPENSIAFNAAAEQFLGACLGGRAEPFGAAFKGSSITVPDGAKFTPGLEAALAAK
ncbi:S9 family peptidase [Nitrospirillum iridis]|uniref:Dipeptidyl aminopeptidase/acylaminoacyl peptidase n=1 Tax=Nitrospirillum iridis TaxID=765888 RepID=A0A7X0EFH4_9PROT|nr:S9 family peptidase [Nitrospirillum iridis]MBB6255027.1 dipeptidyl aminopeptidase/acylaminoacyl peptidase [Nitrospirillum iridis]